MSHVEHIPCVRHPTHKRGEGIQRGVLPALLTISERFFSSCLAGQYISLFIYKNSCYAYPNF